MSGQATCPLERQCPLQQERAHFDDSGAAYNACQLASFKFALAVVGQTDEIWHSSGNGPRQAPCSIEGLYDVKY